MSAALLIEHLRFRHTGADGASFDLRVDRLEIASGEQVLLAGPSGSGKSTLLALISGLLDPDSGSIRIGGDPIHSLSGAARDRFRGRRIGMIFQTFHLLQGFSARQNVEAALLAIGEPAAIQRARAGSLLGSLGISRPDAPVEELSVGQQQRVAVARAIVTRPALVLADEPTASLDPPTASVAMDLIQSVCRDHGAALLCTSHDPSLRSRFERIESIDGLVPASAGTAPARRAVEGAGR